MREILFRGKQVGDGEWIEGYVFPQVIDGGYAPLCITTEPICANDYSEILGDWAIVDSSTVGQYTGLTDKNGKKIFEGDILKIYEGSEDDGYKIRKVYSYGGVLCVDYETSEWDFNALAFLDSDNVFTFEVIGNIHDNPELMGGAQ